MTKVQTCSELPGAQQQIANLHNPATSFRSDYAVNLFTNCADYLSVTVLAENEIELGAGVRDLAYCNVCLALWFLNATQKTQHKSRMCRITITDHDA